jgi:hypothetical protein
MDIRLLTLDGGTPWPLDLSPRPEVVPLRGWGPRLRMVCSFAAFRQFEANLAESLGPVDDTPSVTFVGSGDFHHVSLALVRRLRMPFNLLVLDHHPDWMRGIPFLHCGTWLHHASRLPLCRRIFHVGGDMDFDNHYRWLAPWPALRSGRLTVFPAVRHFRGRDWARVPHQSLRQAPDEPVTWWRLWELLGPYRADLARWPLYISLDKDVLSRDDAAVNWESGHLRLDELQRILTAFIRAAGNRVAGMDIVGDWSPVEAHGWFRKAVAWTEHPSLDVDPRAAALLNERTNRALLATVLAQVIEEPGQVQPPARWAA